MFTMLSLFRRKRSPPAPSPLAQPLAKGLLRPESPAALLATPRRQRLLAQIWQRTAVSREQFTQLYRTPLERYAALVQQFPASEAHHHAYPGGMLDHGLEIVAIALKLRQAHLLPAGAPPEAQAAEAEAWTAGVAYAALLHDIGKVAADIHVEYADGTRWHAWHGPVTRAYQFRYRKDREYRLHSAAAGLLYTDVLGTPIFDWLSGYPDLWAALLHLLAGQYEYAGILGELVIQADRASVAQSLGGDPAKVREAPRQALQRKLLDGLRYLVREVLRLNQPEASDGWLTQDACVVAREQNGLRQAPRPSAVPGHQWRPRPQHGGVRRATGTRHRSANPGWKGDLAGHYHERDWVDPAVHLSAAPPGVGLGYRRSAITISRDCSTRSWTHGGLRKQDHRSVLSTPGSRLARTAHDR